MSDIENRAAGKPVMIKNRVLKERRDEDDGRDERPDGRDLRDRRDEDSRDRAERVAAELRAHRREKPVGVDDFDVSHLAPEGWEYQWHTWSIYEARQNRNMMDSEARGWQPVPKSRHPELMPKDTTLDVIIDKGCILMEIPKEIADEYRRDLLKDARNQVRWKEESIAGTPEGTLPRSEDPRTRPKINKSYEAMKIPD